MATAGCGWGGGWGPHSAPGPDPAVLPPGGSGEEAVPAVTVNGQAASSFHGGRAWHPPPQIRVRVLGLRSAPLTTGWWVGPRGPDCGSGANRLEEGQRSQDRDRQARRSTGAAGGALAAGDRGRSESWGWGVTGQAQKLGTRVSSQEHLLCRGLAASPGPRGAWKPAPAGEGPENLGQGSGQTRPSCGTASWVPEEPLAGMPAVWTVRSQGTQRQRKEAGGRWEYWGGGFSHRDLLRAALGRGLTLGSPYPVCPASGCTGPFKVKLYPKVSPSIPCSEAATGPAPKPRMGQAPHWPQAASRSLPTACAPRKPSFPIPQGPPVLQDRLSPPASLPSFFTFWQHLDPRRAGAVGGREPAGPGRWPGEMLWGRTRKGPRQAQGPGQDAHLAGPREGTQW